MTRLFSVLLSVMLAGISTAQVFTIHHREAVPAIPNTKILSGHLYTLAYSIEHKQALWMAYRLDRSLVGGRNVLERRWVESDRDEWFLEEADYKGAEYQLGHGLPIASVRGSLHAWQCNFLGALFPQTPEANTGPIRRIELEIRNLVESHGEVSVRLGPLFEQPMPPLPAADEPHHVASHFWFISQTDDSVKCWIVPQRCNRTDPPDKFVVELREVVRRSRIAKP